MPHLGQGSPSLGAAIASPLSSPASLNTHRVARALEPARELAHTASAHGVEFIRLPGGSQLERGAMLTWQACTSSTMARRSAGRTLEAMRGGCYCNLSPPECVVARHPRWRGERNDYDRTRHYRRRGSAHGNDRMLWRWRTRGMDKRGEMKMTVLVGEGGAMSIMDAQDAAGLVIVVRRQRF